MSPEQKILSNHARNAKTCAEYIPANASGVVFSFSNWLRDACDMGLDTRARNEHPITIGFMIGLNSMFYISDERYAATIEELSQLIEVYRR